MSQMSVDNNLPHFYTQDFVVPLRFFPALRVPHELAGRLDMAKKHNSPTRQTDGKVCNGTCSKKANQNVGGALSLSSLLSLG
ncbi:hypothetical protein D5086_005107 [Populus alba]|uniref:Uncharacterized protein n=2 Tax=Populus alba TaxID=43335 RepID=A0ACC4CTJ2_POPAL